MTGPSDDTTAPGRNRARHPRRDPHLGLHVYLRLPPHQHRFLKLFLDLRRDPPLRPLPTTV